MVRLKPSFAARLAYVVADRPESVPKQAQAMKVSTSTLYYWIKGRMEPSAKTLVRIGEYYAVSLDWLMGRTDVMSCKTNGGE